MPFRRRGATIPKAKESRRLSIKLHRPMSSLQYGAVELQSQCTPPPRKEAVGEKQRALDFHTAKVLEAAQAGLSLFALPTSCTLQAPLLICGLNMCLLAQMTGCRFNLRDQAKQCGRDRIRLGISILKAFGTVWPLGMSTMNEAKVIAMNVLKIGEGR
jgi:hypothetical protein